MPERRRACWGEELLLAVLSLSELLGARPADMLFERLGRDAVDVFDDVSRGRDLRMGGGILTKELVVSSVHVAS